jgi:putative membrane protein
MVHLLLVWLLSALALVIAAYLLPTVQIDDFGSAMIAALVIGILNATLGWLLRLVVFPLTWLLPGLVYLLVNAVMIYLASKFLRGFKVANFVAALLCALVIAVVNILFGYAGI